MESRRPLTSSYRLLDLMRPIAIVIPTILITHRWSATSSAPSALRGGGHHKPVRCCHLLSHDLLPPSRGRGRRPPVTRVLQHWLLSALSPRLHTPSSALSMGAHPWGLIVPCFMRHPLGAHHPFTNLVLTYLYLCSVSFVPAFCLLLVARSVSPAAVEFCPTLPSTVAMVRGRLDGVCPGVVGF